MEKSNLLEKYNMNMAAISMLNSVISDLEDRRSKLQNESDEMLEKIKDVNIRENGKVCIHKLKCVPYNTLGYCMNNCKAYKPRQT